jgi:hypothetical protein
MSPSLNSQDLANLYWSIGQVCEALENSAQAKPAIYRRFFQAGLARLKNDIIPSAAKNTANNPQTKKRKANLSPAELVCILYAMQTSKMADIGAVEAIAEYVGAGCGSAYDPRMSCKIKIEIGNSIPSKGTIYFHANHAPYVVHIIFQIYSSKKFTTRFTEMYDGSRNVHLQVSS